MSEHIRDAADRAQKSLQKGPQGHSRTRTERGLERRLIEQLFVRLGNIYGHFFMSRFPSPKHLEAGKREWSLGLAGLTERELEAGLAGCAREFKDAPPNLFQFRELCRPKTHPAHQTYRALPRPKANPEVVATHLSRCRAILNTPTPEDE